MNLLLDTQILLWGLSNDKRLTPDNKATIQDAENVYVSIASFWEISIKVSIGKLTLDVTFPELEKAIIDSGFEILAMKTSHIFLLPDLPHLHRDPFDRMLISQSRCEHLHLMTSDQLVAQYDSSVILV